MSLASYGITRNVAATDPQGRPCKIALVVIKHENGFEQTLAINEDEIRFAGEGVIDLRVRQSML
jgi:hypothetical protein